MNQKCYCYLKKIEMKTYMEAAHGFWQGLGPHHSWEVKTHDYHQGYGFNAQEKIASCSS